MREIAPSTRDPSDKKKPKLASSHFKFPYSLTVSLSPYLISRHPVLLLVPQPPTEA